MTYNVFGGTLNLAQQIQPVYGKPAVCMIYRHSGIQLKYDPCTATARSLNTSRRRLQFLALGQSYRHLACHTIS